MTNWQALKNRTTHKSTIQVNAPEKLKCFSLVVSTKSGQRHEYHAIAACSVDALLDAMDRFGANVKIRSQPFLTAA